MGDAAAVQTAALPSGGGDFSTGQLAFLLGLIYTIVAYVYAEVLEFTRHKPALPHERNSNLDLVSEDGKAKEEGDMVVLVGGKKDEEVALLSRADHSKRATAQAEAAANGGSIPVTIGPADGVSGLLFKFVTMNDTFLLEHRLTLRAMAEFGLIVVLFLVTDRSTFFGESSRIYNRDLFLFLYGLLVLVCLFASAVRHVGGGKKIDYLNRHQTEEWKGWMQVLFLMYHYYMAKEIYNAIRVFIACYVWMTGFGNFSYYYVRKDFSLGRFAQMMWRLNFLVFFCCVVLRNDYMLYYICPMHTLFTLMVYACCRVASNYNDNSVVIGVKFAACVAVVVLVWEVPGVFDAIWAPFIYLVGYQDPRRPNGDILYEWRFRSGLDRYIWIVGMLYAYCHPMVERFLERVEELEPKKKATVRAVLAGTCIAAGLYWYETFYSMDKFQYNQWHPYTSWIPITAYIGLRNFLPALRHWSLSLFAWLGKITLETYICQFHVWLRTDIPNGQPVALLKILPEKYPLLNFMLTTALYVTVSLRLFNLTNTLRVSFIPSKDNAKLGQNAITGLVAAAVLYGATFAFIKVPAHFMS